MAPRAEQETALPVDSATLSRLDGSACAVCGATSGLRDSGRIEYTTGTSGSRYGWPVRVCPEH